MDMIQGYQLNNLTNKIVNLTLEIAKTAAANQKQYFIGGGLAIDISVGKITRNHHDIDFHPMLEDFDWWKNWFTAHDYSIDQPASEDFPETCHVNLHEYEAIVDLWPLMHKDNSLLVNYKGEYVNSNRYWNEIREVTFNDVSVWIENPSRILDQKIREAGGMDKLRPQDIHDFKLVGNI